MYISQDLVRKMEITYISNRENLPQGIWLRKYWKTEKIKTQVKHK